MKVNLLGSRHQTSIIALQVVVMKALVIVQLVLVISKSVSSQLVSQKETALNKSCKSSGSIICRDELVKVGTCLTRLCYNSDVAVYGECPYITNDKEMFYRNFYRIKFDIPTLTEQTCASLNRKGLLCSECYDGYGPAVYTFGNECVKCNRNTYTSWTLYLFVVLFPITVFYIIVIIFNVHATAPPLTAFVLYCQVFSIIDRTKMPTPTRFTSEYYSSTMLQVARTLSGIWNLDFGRHIVPPFCVSETLNTYHALLLDYITGFYPMLLILVTYILIKLHSHNFKLIVALWSPFNRCFSKVRRTWNPQASIMNAFATFLILSFTKILFISFYTIQTVRVTMLNGTIHSQRLYYYPPISANSQQHFPFIVLTYSLTTIFVYIPIILLCCYPFKYFKRALFCCCSKRRLVADLFMDTFQGYYKDGTNETYDWRFLSGLYPLLLAVTLPALNRKYRYQYGQVALYILTSAIFSIVRPYKKSAHNWVEIMLLHMLTAILCYAKDSRSLQRANYFSGGDSIHTLGSVIVMFILPHCVFVTVITYRTLMLLQRRFDLLHKCTCLSLSNMWRRFTTAINGDKYSTDQPFVSYGTF